MEYDHKIFNIIRFFIHSFQDFTNSCCYLLCVSLYKHSFILKLGFVNIGAHPNIPGVKYIINPNNWSIILVSMHVIKKIQNILPVHSSCVMLIKTLIILQNAWIGHMICHTCYARCENLNIIALLSYLSC